MTGARLASLCAALLLTQGCRSLHEASIKQRLTPLRFFAQEVPKTPAEVDAFLMARRKDVVVRTWCELCLVSATTSTDGARTYCLSSGEEQGCVVARASRSGGTRFEPSEEGAQVPVKVVRSLWNALDLQGAGAADLSTEDELATLAAEEEARFTPRWSFVLGAKTGAVISYDPPSFTFGGQAGFRYWGSLFVIPGAVLEVESLVQSGRSLVAMSAQGRVELALWGDENARFANLPRISFLMSGGPLVGFGKSPALGGRAALGLHLIHLGPFPTPFFFELGFQALEVDEQSSTGLRVAVGLGF